MVHITWQQIRNDQACPSKKQKEACRLMMKSTGRTSGMDGCVKQAQDFHSVDGCSGPVDDRVYDKYQFNCCWYTGVTLDLFSRFDMRTRRVSHNLTGCLGWCDITANNQHSDSENTFSPPDRHRGALLRSNLSPALLSAARTAHFIITVFQTRFGD